MNRCEECRVSWTAPVKTCPACGRSARATVTGPLHIVCQCDMCKAALSETQDTLGVVCTGCPTQDACRKQRWCNLTGHPVEAVKRHDDKVCEPGPEPTDREDIKRILQRACDRSWKDEDLYQTAIIASNAIYWRDRLIEELREKVRSIPSATTPPDKRELYRLQDLAAAAFPESVALGTRCLQAIRQALAHRSATPDKIDADRYRWLRVRGCALDGSDAQRDGLVHRCINLDEEIDKERLYTEG